MLLSQLLTPGDFEEPSSCRRTVFFEWATRAESWCA